MHRGVLRSGEIFLCADLFSNQGRCSARFGQKRFLYGRESGGRLDIEVLDLDLEFFLCNIEDSVFQEGNITFHDPFPCERCRCTEHESSVGKRKRLHGAQPVVERQFRQGALVENLLQDLFPNRLQF